jgi:hypothetical protein
MYSTEKSNNLRNTRLFFICKHLSLHFYYALKGPPPPFRHFQSNTSDASFYQILGSQGIKMAPIIPRFSQAQDAILFTHTIETLWDHSFFCFFSIAFRLHNKSKTLWTLSKIHLLFNRNIISSKSMGLHFSKQEKVSAR